MLTTYSQINSLSFLKLGLHIDIQKSYLCKDAEIIFGGDSERVAHFSAKNLIEFGLMGEKSHSTVPWFNRKLKRMCRRKARLYKHAKKSKQWMEFKQYQKLSKKEFKQAETDYINKTIQDGLDNNNCKPF